MPMHQLAWEWNTLDKFAERHVLMMNDPSYIRRLFNAALESI